MSGRTKLWGNELPGLSTSAQSGRFHGHFLRSSTQVTSRLATSVRTAEFAGRKCWVNVTTTLAREWVGLEEVGDGLWDVYFSRLRLGRLDQRRMGIEDPYGRWTRWEVLTMSPDKSVTDVSD